MVETNLNSKDYELTLQDRDGITISGTAYLINGGRKISLEADSVVIDLPTVVTVRPRSNRELTGTMNYTSLLGQHTCAGINPIKITVSGKMWADDGSHPRNSDYKPIDIQMLNDIRVYNHKLYLKDYQGGSTTIATPIWSMCTRADLLGNVPYTANGFPVVVTGISNIKRGVDSERGLYTSYKIEMEEDR